MWRVSLPGGGPGRTLADVRALLSAEQLVGAEQRVRPGEWYHLHADETHAARFEVDTAEIEFWFR